MPTYVFRVGTPDGKIIDREVRALDSGAAREELSRQGLHVFKEQKKGFSLESLLPRYRPLSTEKFLLFNQQLLALVKAGLPIVQSFEIMIERQRDLRFREVLNDIRERIQSGVALSDAFEAYGRMFPPIYSTSVRAGEKSGDLAGVIARFIRYQKLLVSLRKKVIGALVYPIVLLVLMTGMIFMMLTYVIPKFAEFYAGFDAELPFATKVAIDLAMFVRHNTVFVLVALLGLVVGIRLLARTDRGRAIVDSVKLRIPFAGSVLEDFAIMQFTQSLGTLLAGGTPMVPAIEIASTAITNKYVGGRIGSIAQRVREGEPLWRSLEDTGVMSDLAIEMIKVGESTGALVEMLANTSEFYDEVIEAKLSRMVALIEPVILIVLGAAIAGLLYAFWLPILQLSSRAQGG
jgi:type IV pilus assembly protein PilC